MPDEFEKVADRIWDRMDKKFTERFDGCTTEACKKARAEVEAVYNRVITEGDTATMAELKKFNTNLDKVFEEIEKSKSAEEVIEPCPNCKFDGTEKSPIVGKCPDGCTKFSKYDKKVGYNNCPICGEDISWDED